MESQNSLYDLYEKLYFHEIDVREKLSGRLQIPLVIIISMAGLLAFMLQNYEKTIWNKASCLFIVFLIAGSLSLIVSIYYFIRSWYGHLYSFLPSAQSTESYQKLLYETYAEYENGDALSKKYLDDYICKYLITCSSVNTQCNDKRTLYLHKTNGWLIIVALLLLLSFLCFYFGDLDKGRLNKSIKVNIENPVSIRGDSIDENYMDKSLMSQTKPNAETLKKQRTKKKDTQNEN